MSEIFHALASDDAKSNPTATPCPAKIMGSGKEAIWEPGDEAPCPEDNKPMMADSINRRGGVRHG